MGIQFQRTNPITPPQTYQLKQEDFFGLIEDLVLSGHIVDVEKRDIYTGRLHIYQGKIIRVERCEVEETHYILPGLIDAHVHIESSMLTPVEFAREAVKHGVVAAVADPHEIANVMGEEGVNFMIENGKCADFKFFFGAPSCVPATPFETSGAALDLFHVEQLLKRDDIYFLSEVMNCSGVLSNDEEIMGKIAAAKKIGKPIDGHAPGLSIEDLKKYIAAGISTDHECVDICEAEEKIHLGMKIIIREGSAAKNFNTLYPLINQYPSAVMVCTDDCHPHELQQGYLMEILKEGLHKGLNLFNILQSMTSNTINNYRLIVGLLRENDFADCIVVDNLSNLTVLQTYINGNKVFDKAEKNYIIFDKVKLINNFNCLSILEHQLGVKAKSDKMRIMELTDSSLITNNAYVTPVLDNDKNVLPNLSQDLLKIVVLNRYEENATPAIGFIRGFGLRSGALCSSVAHDSHNIVAVGADDQSLCCAINAVIENKGGIACCDGEKTTILPLPIAGIMSDAPIEQVAQQYGLLQQQAWALGCPLKAPFMTLAFMSLIVIPELKISDKGLFDVTKFEPVDLFL